MRFPLLGGSYVAKSRIANIQRCINYYPEINREDAPVPFTFYQRPGLRKVASGPASPVRMMYRASNGDGYCCIGQNIYYIDPNFNLVFIGALATNTNNPVRAIDNGGTMLIVDGSNKGYQVILSSRAFSQVVDPTGTFQGANVLAILDTYILWNMPGTVFFGSTLSNSLTFDALYFAGKVGYPDLLSGLIVNRHELILLGTLKSEIWYDAGNPTFPFAQLPGAYIEHGCVSPYTIQSQDIQTYWLAQDLQGQGVVLGLKGYDVKRISNHALENAIRKMPTISDAYAYTYQQNGHYFYVLTFPSGDQTWVYDSSLERDPDVAWHQRCSTDAAGNLHRERIACAANINGVVLGGDYQNGNLYVLDSDYYADDVTGVASAPVTCIKGFPHLLQAPNQMGQVVSTDFHQVQYSSFKLDIECGSAPLQANGLPAQVVLRYSNNRGATFSSDILQTIGAPGAYETDPLWRPLGTARDIVFEIQHTINGPAALNGCWVEAQIMGQT